MRRMIPIILSLGILLAVGGTLRSVEINEQPEGILCAASTDPYVGGNYVALKDDTGGGQYYHDLFNGEYDSVHVERNLQIMEEWGFKYVRVFDGPLMPSEDNLPATVKNNILDFLSRAANHDLIVYWQFTHVETWMNADPFSEQGKADYAGRIKYITQQCFADKTQDMVISLINEPIFDPDDYESEMVMRWTAINWTNYIDGQFRTVDTRANHKTTVDLMQTDAETESVWPWHPGDQFNFTNTEIVCMHFYHINGNVTASQEFDTCFGWWTPSCTKPIIVGESGVMIPQGNEKEAAQEWLTLLHYIRGDEDYDDIEGIIYWTFDPYYKTYEIDAHPVLYHRLVDGEHGYTRLGVSIWYDQYVDATFSANYATLAGYPASNVNDYTNTAATSCIITHVPSAQSPNETVMSFGQWYRFHKIRIVDPIAPVPKDFNVYISGPSGWELFGSVTNNTQATVDIVSSSASGYQAGHAVKVVVYDESANWSSLGEIYVNPITTVSP